MAASAAADSAYSSNALRLSQYPHGRCWGLPRPASTTLLLPTVALGQQCFRAFVMQSEKSGDAVSMLCKSEKNCESLCKSRVKHRFLFTGQIR